VLDKVRKEAKGDELAGVEAVAEALCVPLRTIADNAGAKGTVVVSKVKEMKGDEGFNALTLEYGDLVKQGVITPAKVDRTALQNAASVAGLILTCDCAISIKPQPKGEAPDDHHAHGGHQGMGGMF
jgi:chaperonin GroEL